MATIRSELEKVFDSYTVNSISRHAAGTKYDLLDSECLPGARFCATYGTGSLQFTCGGDCIISLKPPSGRGSYYIIYRDSDGKAWDCKRHNGVSGPGGLPGGKPRPHARLELVRSA